MEPPIIAPMLDVLARIRAGDPRWAAGAVFLLGTVVLATVYGSQYLGGLQPCTLCLYQRWPWWAATGLTLAVLLFGGTVGWARAVLGLAGTILLIGAGIAVYHVGVEQHWWAGLSGCTAPPTPATLEELRRQILSAPVVRCDEVAWSLFGISMAGYNALASVPTGSFLIAAALRRERGTP